MLISIPDDFEDLRRIRRERPPDPSRQPEPLLEPGPLDQRLERLREQAGQRNFPEIPPPSVRTQDRFRPGVEPRASRTACPQPQSPVTFSVTAC